MLLTTINNPSLVHNADVNNAMQIDRAVAQSEIAKRFARPPDKFIEPLVDNPDDVASICAFLNFVSKNTGHGIWWTTEVERWINNNLKPDSPLAIKFEAYYRDMDLHCNEIGCLVRFKDFADFKRHFLTAIYQGRPLHEIINRYINNVVINHRDPKAPKTLLELIDKCRNAFSLLATPDCQPESAQVEAILARFPEESRLKIRNYFDISEATTMDYRLLEKFAKIVDNDFARRRESTTNKNPSRHPARPDNITRRPPGPDHRQRNRDHHREHRPYYRYTSRRPDNRDRRPDNRDRRDRPDYRRERPDERRHRREDDRAPKRPNHYTGECAKCGKMGHSIYDCHHASEEDKQAFRDKVAETKRAKLANPATKGMNKLSLTDKE